MKNNKPAAKTSVIPITHMSVSKKTSKKTLQKNSGQQSDKKVSKSVKSSFSLPLELLQKIDECTRGGFVLVYIDSDGSFQTRSKFDSAVECAGLVTYGAKFFEVAQDVLENGMADRILGEDHRENPPEESA